MIADIQKGSVKFMLSLFFFVGGQVMAMDDNFGEIPLTNNTTPVILTPNNTPDSSVTSPEFQKPKRYPVLSPLVIPHMPTEEITNIIVIYKNDITAALMDGDLEDKEDGNKKCNLSRYQSDSLQFK